MLVVWVGLATSSQAQQQQFPSQASSAAWLGILFWMHRPCSASTTLWAQCYPFYMFLFCLSQPESVSVACNSESWLRHMVSHLPSESVLFHFKSHVEKYLEKNCIMFYMTDIFYQIKTVLLTNGSQLQYWEPVSTASTVGHASESVTNKEIKKWSLGILFYFLYQIRTDLMAPLSLTCIHICLLELEKKSGN